MRYIPEQSLHNRWDLITDAGGQRTDGKALKSQRSSDKANLGALGPSTRRKRPTLTELEALTFWDNLANVTFPRSVLRKSASCYHAFKSGWEVHTEIFDPFWLLRISTWVPSLSEHWQIRGGPHCFQDRVPIKPAFRVWTVQNMGAILTGITHRCLCLPGSVLGDHLWSNCGWTPSLNSHSHFDCITFKAGWSPCFSTESFQAFISPAVSRQSQFFPSTIWVSGIKFWGALVGRIDKDISFILLFGSRK